MAEPRARRRKSDDLVKCPVCHSYFVKEGEICPKCEAKQSAEVGDDADELEAE